MIIGDGETGTVYIGNKKLNPNASLGLVNHSPDGFGWGYGGSGPAQLALALLLHYSNEDFALKHYQDFKWEIIAALPSGDFHLDEEDVVNWVKENK